VDRAKVKVGYRENVSSFTGDAGGAGGAVWVGTTLLIYAALALTLAERKFGDSSEAEVFAYGIPLTGGGVIIWVSSTGIGPPSASGST
jgi:hypothetical protein